MAASVPSLQNLCIRIINRSRPIPVPISTAVQKVEMAVPITVPKVETPVQIIPPAPITVPKMETVKKWPNRITVIDTETTGLTQTDRICEIAAIDIEIGADGIVREREVFHRYCNPGRASHPQALAVHGLTEAFLSQHPVFPAAELVDFLGDRPIVMHNAAFDLRFINRELMRVGRPILLNPIYCTLIASRKQWPKISHRLDNLCAKWGINLEGRAVGHSAIVDARLVVPLLSYIHPE